MSQVFIIKPFKGIGNMKTLRKMDNVLTTVKSSFCQMSKGLDFISDGKTWNLFSVFDDKHEHIRRHNDIRRNLPWKVVPSYQNDSINYLSNNPLSAVGQIMQTTLEVYRQKKHILVEKPLMYKPIPQCNRLLAPLQQTTFETLMQKENLLKYSCLIIYNYMYPAIDTILVYWKFVCYQFPKIGKLNWIKFKLRCRNWIQVETLGQNENLLINLSRCYQMTSATEPVEIICFRELFRQELICSVIGLD